MSCTLFAFMGFLVSMPFLRPFFISYLRTYLRQDKKVDNVGQNPTNLN